MYIAFSANKDRISNVTDALTSHVDIKTVVQRLRKRGIPPEAVEVYWVTNMDAGYPVKKVDIHEYATMNSWMWKW